MKRCLLLTVLKTIQPLKNLNLIKKFSESSRIRTIFANFTSNNDGMDESNSGS